MTNTSLKLSPEEVTALRGMRLPAVALKQLRTAGIYCEPAITMERQHGGNLYVLRGVESGGCVTGLGAYCSFVAPDGGLLPWLQRAQCVGVNGVHAIVVAPAFARLQMFWTNGICELLITSHELECQPGRPAPQLKSRILFHARDGMLDRDADHLPIFLTRAGEELVIPKQFQDAIRRLAKAVLCSPCRHVHVLTAPV